MIYHLWQAMYHHQHMLFSMTFRLSQYSPHGVNGDAGGGRRGCSGVEEVMRIVPVVRSFSIASNSKWEESPSPQRLAGPSARKYCWFLMY